MPILNVEIVLRKGEELENGLAQKIADATADVFDTPPQQTWVKISSLPAEQYAENKVLLTTKIKPVFVSIIKTRILEGDSLKKEAAGLASAIGYLVNRPDENIHIIYEAPAQGRVAFGGRFKD